ncbi:hypothetical protein ACVJBD_002928 [Rhizobium mongolense]
MQPKLQEKDEYEVRYTDDALEGIDQHYDYLVARNIDAAEILFGYPTANKTARGISLLLPQSGRW